MKVASRHVFAATVGLRLALASHEAWAWTEMRLLADDVRVEVDRAGTAVVGHTVRIKVQGGPLRWLDVPGVDPDAAPLEGAAISVEKAGQPTWSAALSPALRPDGTLRLTVDSSRGVSRGTFVVQFRYRTNLMATDRLARDGQSWRVRWSGPGWTEGLDNARCTFVLPASGDEPRATPPRDGRGSEVEGLGAFLTSVRRGREFDELELLRPHVARAEAVPWTAYVDLRAFGPPADNVQAGEPAAASSERREADPELRAGTWGLVALLVLFSALVGAKARSVASNEPSVARRCRPLLPLHPVSRAALAGPLLAAGIALQYEAVEPAWGTVLLLLAMALTTYLPASWRAEPRGPGRWLALRDDDAFVPRPSGPFSWLDGSTWRGKAACSLAGAVLVAAAVVLGRRSPYDGCLAAFDALVLIPIWWTGRRTDSAPDLFVTPAPRLERLARKLRAMGLRAVAWGRWPKGGSGFDELRLMVAPRLPLPGFCGIEIGYVPAPSANASLMQPEVLVRVVEGTSSHEALRGLLRGHRWVRGRKPDERVALLQPLIPTLECTAALAMRIAQGARESDLKAEPGRQVSSPERRYPPQGGHGAGHPMRALRRKPAEPPPPLNAPPFAPASSRGTPFAPASSRGTPFAPASSRGTPFAPASSRGTPFAPAPSRSSHRGTEASVENTLAAEQQLEKTPYAPASLQKTLAAERLLQKTPVAPALSAS